MHAYPWRNNRVGLITSRSAVPKPRPKKNDSDEKAPRISECQMWGAGGGRAAEGLRVTLQREARCPLKLGMLIGTHMAENQSGHDGHAEKTEGGK